MLIQGIQKLTLLDYPGHVAGTVFLAGCDFRCPFCHNFELVDGRFLSQPPAMTEDEFFAFLKTRKGLLDGVAITGGEPCLRRDLPEFIAKIRDKGFDVKLDTNGNHPEMLETLIDQRLVNYVAMDVKNSPAKYTETVGLEALNLDFVMESINLLIKGTRKGRTVPYEFRTTVINEFHRVEDMEEIGRLIQGAKKYFIQPFVDREMVPDHSLSAPPAETLEKFRAAVAPFVENVELRGL